MVKQFSFSECLAHPGDPLPEHLYYVATGVDVLFDSERTNLRDAAVLAALFHDVGKATGWFQARIRRETTAKPRESYHAELSAVIAWHVSKGLGISSKSEKDRWRLFLFLAILKHHGDLDYSWVDRLKMVKNNDHDVLTRQLKNLDLSGIETWLSEVSDKLALSLQLPSLSPESILHSLREVRIFRLPRIDTISETLQFLQVFGALLQADKIHSATKTFGTKDQRISKTAVDHYLSRFPSSGPPINELRNELNLVVEKSLEQASGNGKLFTLTAPTGSGKTLTVLNGVLKFRDKVSGERGVSANVIYCLPFTSIIEQNFGVFWDLLVNNEIEPTSDRLLKHHHLTDMRYETGEGEFKPLDAALFVETWQSEIVVTTFHQLLYTIFTNRNRNLKRFAQLRHAIVILDEVQAIPRKYWDPIRRVFQEISRGMGTTFILMTATKPLIFTEEVSTELVPEPEKYFKRLNRFELINRTDKPVALTDFAQELATQLEEKRSQMTVVNTRRAAVELYNKLKEELPDRQMYFLSTNLTPKDRKDRIHKISNKLDNGESCILVTTQLVEAGVDLSFDRVDRDFAPLDSVIQAAGRCNRHNLNSMGRVTLWDFVTEEDGRHYAKMVYRDPILLEVTKEVLGGRERYEESDLQQLGERYFRLMWERSDEQPVDEILAAGEFEKIEDEFVLIDERWFQQSYFVIQNDEDQKIWDWFQSLREIDDRLERKAAFFERRSIFLDRVIQVPLHSDDRPDEGIIPLNLEENRYNAEIGYIMEGLSGGSIAIF